MVNIKRKTDKILAILLIAILAGVGTSVFAMTSQRVSVSADTYADDTNYVNYERHIATIDDDFASNRVIVTLKPGYSDVNKSFSTQNLRTSDNTIIESVKDLTRMENPSKITNRASFTQILSIELRQDSKEGVLRAIEELEQLDMVLAAEPDYYLESEDLWQPPDDTGFNQQWGLGAAPGIRAQQAWTMTTGETNPRINVGIFETGLDANHNDLRVITGNVGSTDPTHGTFVGGVIGAITHNNRGVAGIAQVNLAQLDRGNGGNLNNNNQGVFPQSLVWAIDNDIRIVNCSFRFALNGAIMRQPIVAHREAIRVFGENGGLLVAAAGNDTEDIDVTRTFPAAYGDARDFPEITNVITVGSIDSDGGLSSFSNWGANSVHIYAPGRNILSTIPTGSTPAGYRRHSDGYAYGDGTSFAAPHVSGVAALMLSVNPDFTPQDLRNNLINSGDVVTLTTPDTSFWPWQNNSITFTSRRLNAEAALAPFTTSTYGLLSNQISITGVISGATLPANLVIPANLNGRTVTSIENGAFYGCTGLTSVTIPNGVKSIGNGAFYGCTGLTSVTIPNGVTSIGNGAFYGCTGLTSVTIPNGVTSIGDSAFSGTTADIYSSLYKISFPSSTQISIDGVKPGVTLAGDLVIPTSLHGRTVTGIGASAFANKTGITSILIHDNVTSIASDAFSGTTADIYSSLYKISFPSSTQISIDGVRPGITLPSNLVIPNFINGRTVTTIGNEAFAAHSGLTGITIPNTVTKIGDWAFAFCSGLTSITIPGSVTTIGQAVFLSCYSLAGVTIPNSVTSIGQSAFLGCGSLTSITIPSSVTKIEDDAFSFCNNLTTVYIERPSSWGITTLGNSVFAFSPLAVIYVPDTASVTAYKAAANWSYYSALIDKPFVPTPGLAYTYILSSNSYAVSKGAANTNGVVYIPARYNGLPVTEIAQSGFSNCTNLTGVVFEAGSFLHTVGNEAFLLCSGLTSITLPNSVTNIEGSAFIFSGLTSITIPGKVTTIKKDAFRWCNSLASITIPNSVTSIEQGALYGCRSLTSITIPSGVTEIADWAFAYCIGVTSITIPNGVTSIGNGAFGGCNGLTSIAIPNGVTSIGDFAFGECVDLTSVTIPNSVVSIGDQAFAFCLKLTSITIPSSVASLRYMAFAFCSNLATVYIERPSVLGITTLDSEAFLCSPNLAAIYVPDAASVSVYQGANGWSTYANRIYPL